MRCVSHHLRNVEQFLTFRIGLTALLLLPAIGCSDGRPSRLAVSGQVLIDGQPLSYGFIRFVPEVGRQAAARLDEQGRFILSTYEKHDGVIPGEFKVEVDGSEELSAKKRMWHAPKKYFRYTTSDLTQSISEPTDSLVINLTWDGGEPFVERLR